MAQEEIWNHRDRSYSAWHRRFSIRRFIGIEKAQLLGMIDLDASLYVEYDDGTREPLALIETAIDMGQRFKSSAITARLAQRARLPAFVLLYSLSETVNPVDRNFQDIKSFRYRCIYPYPDKDWIVVSPQEWATILVNLRQRSAENVDKILDSELGEVLRKQADETLF